MKIELRMAYRCQHRNVKRCFNRRDWERHFVPFLNELTGEGRGLDVFIWKVPNALSIIMEVSTPNDALWVRKAAERLIKAVNSMAELGFSPKWSWSPNEIDPEYNWFQWEHGREGL